MARHYSPGVDGIVNDPYPIPWNSKFIDKHFSIALVDRDVKDHLRQGTRVAIPVIVDLRNLDRRHIGKTCDRRHHVVYSGSEDDVRRLAYE